MATITMSALAKKYNDFKVPAMKVKSGGVDLVGNSEYAVESVTVTLSQTAASVAVIKLTNVYDVENRSFCEDIRGDFKLGKLVEVEMGYGSSLTPLFYGYIEEITYEISGNPSVQVVATDVRKMMMGSQKGNISHQVKSYSDAFQEVMKKYKPVYKSQDVDVTDKLETDCILQNGNDYDFIKEELCRKANRDFFIHAGTVYFKDISAELFYTVELEWAKDIISFQRRASFQDMVIRVYGQDVDKKEEVTTEIKVKADDEQKTLVQSEKTEMDAAVTDNREAKKIAEHEADEMKKRARQASGVCIGIPEIQAGGRVRIKKGDARLIDGVYDIREAKHSFSASGYQTSFEVGG